jgi:hypothetical protein
MQNNKGGKTMRKLAYAMLLVSVFSLFLAGCGSKNPTGEVVSNLNQETTPVIEGKDCVSLTDCDGKEKIGEPFCLSGESYQKTRLYRCGYRSHKCESFIRDLRVGAC